MNDRPRLNMRDAGRPMISFNFFTVAGFAAFIWVNPWFDAYAKNLDVLTRLLIPAYMAQDFTGLCSTQDAQFLSAELSDGIAAVSAYAQHRKKEITIDIPEQDAAQVRVTAADTAMMVIRQELHKLAAQQSADPTRTLKTWCERSAKPFILEIVRTHDETHRQFDEVVERAKR